MSTQEEPAELTHEYERIGIYYDLMIDYIGTITGDLSEEANFRRYTNLAYEIGTITLSLDEEARQRYAPWLINGVVSS